MTDQASHPIAGAIVSTFQLSKGGRGSTDYVNLSPEAAESYQTRTGADGSFVIHGVPRGASIQAKIRAEGFASPRVLWDSAEPPTIKLDNRFGQIKGKLKPPDSRRLSGESWISLRGSTSPPGPDQRPLQMLEFEPIRADQRGLFSFDKVPPGRYVLAAYFGAKALVSAKPIDNLEVAPNSVVNVDVPLDRRLIITGRVVDARTGAGVGGIKLDCVKITENQRYLDDSSRTETDAEGRYSVTAPPGKVLMQVAQLPKGYLGPSNRESGEREVVSDITWPDLKLTLATAVDGVVVDQQAHPVAGAEVFLLADDSRRAVEIATRFGPAPTADFMLTSLTATNCSVCGRGARKRRPTEPS